MKKEPSTAKKYSQEQPLILKISNPTADVHNQDEISGQIQIPSTANTSNEKRSKWKGEHESFVKNFKNVKVVYGLIEVDEDPMKFQQISI